MISYSSHQHSSIVSSVSHIWYFKCRKYIAQHSGHVSTSCDKMCCLIFMCWVIHGRIECYGNKYNLYDKNTLTLILCDELGIHIFYMIHIAILSGCTDRVCCHIKSSISWYPTKHTQAILCRQVKVHRSSSSRPLSVQADDGDYISGL